MQRDGDEKLGLVRHFLGWDRRFLDVLLEWLWPLRNEFPRMMVVVPTGQSGRRLRESLAERGGCLAPRVVTPSAFFRPDGEAVGKLAEALAWEQVLSDVDWAKYESIMPTGTVAGEDFGRGMAQQLRSIRSELAEVGLDIGRVANRLGKEHAEADRWQALAELETLYRREVRRLGGEDLQDAKRAAAGAMTVPDGVERLVIAGVPDPVPLAGLVWRRWASEGALTGGVDILIHAPEEQEENFDCWGVPCEEYWQQATLDLPDGNDAIVVCDTPSHQAEEAVKQTAALCHGMNEVSRRELTFGVCDGALLPDLRRRFEKVGWDLYDPAGQTLGETGLIGWLTSLREWIVRDDVRSLATILPQVWTGRLLEKEPFFLSLSLARVIDMALPQNTADFGKIATAEWLNGEIEREQRVMDAAAEIEKVCNSLGYWRERFRMAGASTTMREMLAKVMVGDSRIEGAVDDIAGLLGEVAALEQKAKNVRPERWLSIIIQAMGQLRVDSRKAERSLDAQGWLELSYESAPKLLLCGFNEGIVPEITAGDPWLPNSLRVMLGMKSNTARYARDAFYTRSLVESRRADGEVRFLFGRRAAGGEPMRPSRLILKPGADAQAARVKHAFAAPKIEKKSAAWERDWQLELIEKSVKPRMSVTGLNQYLICPFRYYLKHVLRMQKPEELREEWSPREFGTIVHEVVEAFGREPEVRDYTKTEAIEAWLVAKFDAILATRFTGDVPLAVDVQSDSVRKRLGAFARAQAVRRVEGWVIDEVEWDFRLEIEGVTFRGKIDRIDRHEKSGEWMVWDYKTGKDALKPKSHHCVEMRSNTVTPEHLKEREEFVFPIVKQLSKGPVDKPHLWRDLQLPLYALAMRDKRNQTAGVGYIAMTPVLSDIGFYEWEDYEPSITESAAVAAGRVAQMFKTGVFMPAAEKVTYDDYEELLDGETIAEAFAVNFDLEGVVE